MTARALLLAFACCASALAAGAPLPTVPPGFHIERIATVEGARELAFAPNGDLFVGTNGNDVDVIADAEGAHPQAPQEFARISDAPAAGVAVSRDAVYVGGQFGVYRFAYHPGERHARGSPQRLASVRTSGISRDHVTTSVALDGNVLYYSVGSSCNACRPELDPTRATIHRIDLRSGRIALVANNVRNAIALTVDPRTHVLWAGVAGVDDLPPGHPYEIFDAVTLHPEPVNYGWPSCYENHKHARQWPGSCADAAIPRVVFPAYETPIGAVFYPESVTGDPAFARYRGGAFVALHGSWHGPRQGLSGFVPPRVVFVPMHGDTPARPVNWSDPNTQWQPFVTGYQAGESDERIGRPTGVAVGPHGSLFVADDLSGAIYRIR